MCLLITEVMTFGVTSTAKLTRQTVILDTVVVLANLNALSKLRFSSWEPIFAIISVNLPLTISTISATVSNKMYLSIQSCNAQ